MNCELRKPNIDGSEVRTPDPLHGWIFAEAFWERATVASRAVSPSPVSQPRSFHRKPPGWRSRKKASAQVVRSPAGGESSPSPVRNSARSKPASPQTVGPDTAVPVLGDAAAAPESRAVDRGSPEVTPEQHDGLDAKLPRSPPPERAAPRDASAADGDELDRQTNPDPDDDLDSFNLIEPPPLDWRSDSSSDGGSVGGTDDSSLLQPDAMDTPEERRLSEPGLPLDPGAGAAEPGTDFESPRDDREGEAGGGVEVREGGGGGGGGDLSPEPSANDPPYRHSGPPSETGSSGPAGPGTGPTPTPMSDVSALLPAAEGRPGVGLLFSESNQRDLLGLLEDEEQAEAPPLRASPAAYVPRSAEVDAVVSVSYSLQDGERFWDHFANGRAGDGDEAVSPDDELPEPAWLKTDGRSRSEEEAAAGKIKDKGTEDHPAYKDVPGPCDPEDLLDGVIFGAKYLGSTQLLSEKNPSTNARMAQAQEAVDRIKAPEGESQPMTEVDLFISTQRIKVLSADTQEAMMDHSLQMISYIADIGPIVVLMARRKASSRKGAEGAPASSSPATRKKCCMICHVFSSDDAQVIAQAIGQAFGVAYQQFLHVNGIKATELRPSEYSDYLGTQELYNGDLVHFSRSENIREVRICKAAGEILGLAVVESGWGSIVPTVVVANLLHGGPAERSGELSIGDRVMSVNGTSLVGLPITTCHGIIRDLKNQAEVKLSIVHCPPVTMAIIKRPDPKYQLGFSVEDGIICSLMRGGIAERGGIRVGHRIIEINGQSVVATPHEKIINILTHAVGEIHLKTMPASTYRLLTGQEQPVFL
ncbi:hypothetical protein AAFF_G00257550 [Aldrovandia affinis]|uniref:Amyloid-beta A4 precursor protein-binding family A member 3 n=1 Tax=Aldrovandia affinis TaxID=143900 RepID=A0AAD7WT04_9TELE|nr:hypothetical protein AAFF_G00257550 [Aldrovandia affinis]